MSIRSADRDWNHLYPPFREQLRPVLEAVATATGEPWRIVEGYRSPERQLWLYAQGRTRPGRIVTWMKTPKWHGTGLAADVLPTRRGYGAPMRYWEALRAAYQAVGLGNPAWRKGDLGHVQLTDNALRGQSLPWVRAGFPATEPAAPSPELTVIVNGEVVPDADAFRRSGSVWAALRPIADALELTITAAHQGQATLVSDHYTWAVPLEIREGRGFVPVRQLPAQVQWDGATKTVSIDQRVTAIWEPPEQ